MVALPVCAESYTFHSSYLQPPEENVIYYNSIFGFLNSIMEEGVEGVIVYDAKINESIIQDYASFLNISFFKYDDYPKRIIRSPLRVDKSIIFIGNKDSQFINSDLRNLLQDSDALIVLDEDTRSTLTIVSQQDPFVVFNLLYNLKFYYNFPELDESFVYFDIENNFTIFGDMECDETKETDLGDNNLTSGCLNNDFDWMCDECYDRSNLVEFYCSDNTSFFKIYKCPFGCKNGACQECTKGWLNEYRCSGKRLMRLYQRPIKSHCYSSWKTFRYCLSGCDKKENKCVGDKNLGVMEARGVSSKPISGKVISEISELGISDKIHDIFYNLLY